MKVLKIVIWYQLLGIKGAILPGIFFKEMGGEMIVTCPDCHSKAKLRDELAGKTVRCPKCSAEFMAAQTAQQQKWYYASGSEKIGPM